MLIETLGGMKKALLGRTIVRIDWNRFQHGRGGFTTDPVFTLDDGTTLRFGVRETEVGEYGIEAAVRTKE